MAPLGDPLPVSENVSLLSAAAAFPRPPQEADGRPPANWLKTKQALSLEYTPASASALALIEQVTKLVDAHERETGTRTNARAEKTASKFSDAVARILAGLLWGFRNEEPQPVFHGMSSRQWGKTLPVSWRRFEAVIKALRGLKLIGWADGYQGPSADHATFWQGMQTRSWPTDALLGIAEEHGITPATLKTDFVRIGHVGTVAPVVEAPLVFRGLPKRQGERGLVMPVPSDDPIIPSLARQVEEMNDRAEHSNIGGCLPPRWFRGFTVVPQLHGRWYARGSGHYQLMSEVDRLRLLTINGEGVAEIDVSSAYLSIMHGLLGLPLPDGDLYGLSGFERGTVKTAINQTLGNGRPSRTAVSANRPLYAAIKDRYPFMAAPAQAVADAAGLTALAHVGPPEKLLVHRLMAIEADAMTVAANTIMDFNGPRTTLVLPMHDGMIVPKRFAGAAEHAIEMAFKHRAGVKVRVKSSIG